MSNKKVRNAEIDFLRLIFSIAVVFYHCKTFLTPNGGPEIFPRGAIAVEFFFILSGFLMARSAQKVGPNPDVGRETCKYIVSRYRMLWLYMIPAAILLVAELISSSGSLRTAPRYTAQGLAELLCLSQAGLFSQDVNAPAWYLSALILCSWLLFPLVRRVIQRTVTSTSYLFRSFLLLILSSILSIAMVVFVRLLQRVWNNHLRAICRQAFLSD